MWHAPGFFGSSAVPVFTPNFVYLILPKNIFTYSIDNGCIQQAMVQCDLTTGGYFDNIRKPNFSNFELEKTHASLPASKPCPHACWGGRMVRRE